MVPAHFHDLTDEKFTVSEIKFDEKNAGPHLSHTFVSLNPS